MLTKQELKTEEQLIVIEGTYQDEIKRLHYTLSEAKIPREAIGEIEGSLYSYKLVGLTEGSNIGRVLNPQGDIVKLNVDRIDVFDRPRTIITEDGRIFSDVKGISDFEEYFIALEPSIPKIFKSFKEERLKKQY